MNRDGICPYVDEDHEELENVKGCFFPPRFVLDFSRIARPITELNWTGERDEAFSTLKNRPLP